jgi:hypothetical protein
MHTSIKGIFAAGAVASLLTGAAAFAQTNWAPPAEIAPKATTAETAAPTTAPAAAPAAPVAKQDKDKICADQAAAKGLKGKAKKQFRAECLKS